MTQALKIQHLDIDKGGCRPKNLNLLRTQNLAELSCLLCVRRFYDYMASTRRIAEGVKLSNLTTTRTVREVQYFNGRAFKNLKYDGCDISVFQPSYYAITVCEVDPLTYQNSAVLDKKLKFLEEGVRRYNLRSPFKIRLRSSLVTIPLRHGLKPLNIGGIAIITNLGNMMTRAFLHLYLNASKTLISAFERRKLAEEEYEAYMHNYMDFHLQQIYDNTQYTKRWYIRPLARVIGSYGLVKFYETLSTHVEWLTDRELREDSVYWQNLPLGRYPFLRSSNGFRAESEMNDYR